MRIYVRDGCPFSATALAKIDALGIKVEERNVSDPKNVEELIALGGKKQEPFLVDDECGVKMYEADAIIEYLNSKYGMNEETGEAAIPEGTCPA